MDYKYGYYPKYDFFNNFVYQYNYNLEYKHYNYINTKSYNSPSKTNYQTISNILAYLKDSKNNIFVTYNREKQLADYLAARILYLNIINDNEEVNKYLMNYINKAPNS
jgi:hypothetical protein